MAETKPTKVPIWNEGGANRQEPTSGKKTLGWVLGEDPVSSSFVNWLQYFAGAWLKWFNERFFDGSAAEDFDVQAVDAPAGTDNAGGILGVSGGSSTGDAGSKVEFRVAQAGQGAGATVRTPSTFATLDTDGKLKTTEGIEGTSNGTDAAIKGTGTNTSEAIEAAAGATGDALLATATAGVAVRANSSSGYAIDSQSQLGIRSNFTSTGGVQQGAELYGRGGGIALQITNETGASFAIDLIALGNTGGQRIDQQGNADGLQINTANGVALELIAGGGKKSMGFTTYLEGVEISDPAAPSSNRGRIYFKDNGAGKTQLVVRFPTGAVQVIATEP